LTTNLLFETQSPLQNNILIDHDGTARLIDFGLSTIKPEFDGNSFNSSTIGGAIRWLAPELLPGFGKTRVLNLSSDIYSLGSVILQVSLALHR
jgi:serine/threonine protein kinase